MGSDDAGSRWDTGSGGSCADAEDDGRGTAAPSDVLQEPRRDGATDAGAVEWPCAVRGDDGKLPPLVCIGGVTRGAAERS